MNLLILKVTETTLMTALKLNQLTNKISIFLLQVKNQVKIVSAVNTLQKRLIHLNIIRIQ